jgi:hypothetical protein
MQVSARGKSTHNVLLSASRTCDLYAIGLSRPEAPFSLIVTTCTRGYYGHKRKRPSRKLRKKERTGRRATAVSGLSPTHTEKANCFGSALGNTSSIRRAILAHIFRMLQSLTWSVGISNIADFPASLLFSAFGASRAPVKGLRRCYAEIFRTSTYKTWRTYEYAIWRSRFAYRRQRTRLRCLPCFSETYRASIATDNSRHVRNESQKSASAGFAVAHSNMLRNVRKFSRRSIRDHEIC